MSNKENFGYIFDKECVGQARKLEAEYAFNLKQIPELIRIRIYRQLQGEVYEIEQSHYLQPPGLSLPAMSGTDSFNSIEDALNDTLAVIDAPYQAAIGKGLQPDTDWLLPNRDFH